MRKLVLFAVVAAALSGGCDPYPYHHYGYGYGYYHAHWRHHGYWRRGFWRSGVYVDNYIYVDPDAALPAGVTVPEAQVDAYGNVIGPNIVTAPPANAVVAPGTVAPGPLALPTN